MAASLALPSRLLAIADYGLLGERIVDAALAAHRGGVDWLLLRAKKLETTRRAELAKRISSLAPTLFLSMHGDLEAARISECRGVHHASDGITECSRSTEFLVGASCHNAGELRAARECGACYALLSPVFGTISKESLGGPLGVDAFGRLAGAAGIPVLALGGMTPAKATQVRDVGGYGVAVLGDLFMAEDIERRARGWRDEIERIYGAE